MPYVKVYDKGDERHGQKVEYRGQPLPTYKLMDPEDEPSFMDWAESGSVASTRITGTYSVYVLRKIGVGWKNGRQVEVLRYCRPNAMFERTFRKAHLLRARIIKFLHSIPDEE